MYAAYSIRKPATHPLADDLISRLQQILAAQQIQLIKHATGNKYMKRSCGERSCTAVTVRLLSCFRRATKLVAIFP
jgi:hypothetical protein